MMVFTSRTKSPLLVSRFRNSTNFKTPTERKGMMNMKSLQKLQIAAASALVGLLLSGCNQQAATPITASTNQEPVAQSMPPTPTTDSSATSTNNLPALTTDSSATSTSNPLSPTGISSPTVTDNPPSPASSESANPINNPPSSTTATSPLPDTTMPVSTNDLPTAPPMRVSPQ